MVISSYPAVYRDGRGEETTTLYREGPGFHMTVRGVEFRSAYDICMLETELAPTDSQLSAFTIDADGGLKACVLAFSMPILVVVNSTDIEGILSLRLDYGEVTAVRGSLRAKLTFDTYLFESTGDDDWTETALQEIQSLLLSGTYIKCCFTCAFSDYNPAGGPLACFRDNKTAYSKIGRSKPEIFGIWNTLTEAVHETYLCPEFAHRVPGTGWRG